MKINFKQLFEEKILDRGYNYYTDNSVHEVTKQGNFYQGIVYGTEVYEVQVELDKEGNVEDMNCDCPYAEGNNCKHMAALLYYIENDGEIKPNKKLRKVDNYDKILDRIPKEELQDFIVMKLQQDNNFQNEFRSNFVQYFEKTPKNVYQKRISQSIYQAIGRKGFIEYNETYKFTSSMYDYIYEATNLIKHKEYEAPFWIASLILEELPDIPIDDSDGSTGCIESECVEVMQKILENCKNDELVNEIFDWINDSIKTDRLGDYSGEVEELLDEYFNDDKYAIERLKIIDEKMEKLRLEKSYYSEYKLANLVKTKISLLYQLDKNEEALKVIKDNIYIDSIRKMLIDIEKANANISMVEKLLKDGMQIAIEKRHLGTLINYIEELLTFYEKYDKKLEYKKLVEETLFEHDKASFKYYKKLKELYSDEQWKIERDVVIKKLENNSNGYYMDYLRQIYIEEQYFDKLYNSVMATQSYQTALRYEKYLKNNYEEKLLEIYKKAIDERARLTGKNNYEELRSMLSHIQTLKNGDKIAKELVDEYRVKYGNRRLMMEMLDKI